MSLSVAVIGSGMAGLAAAYRSRQSGHQVRLFEAQQGYGMDAHTLEVEGGRVDAPLRVMSPEAWPSVLQLAEEVGVGSFPSPTWLSCSWVNQQTWFRSGPFPGTKVPFAGSWRYLNSKSLRLAMGLKKLKQLTSRLDDGADGQTLEELLDRQQLDPLFWRGLILPILTTICTCEERHLLAWPAGQLLQLLDGILHNGSLCRLKGGTPALALGLGQGLPLYSGSRIKSVRYEGDQVRVENERGEGGLYDRVILAVQANQLDFLDGQQFALERQLLGQVRYDSGELWIHRDERFMPAKPDDWTALNFQMDEQLRKPMFTVWVNAVEPTLEGKAPIFQTWNPLYEPRADQTLARIPLQRAVVHTGMTQVYRQLDTWHQQPGRKVFFCGSWASEGVPLLESAVASAEKVVSLLD